MAHHDLENTLNCSFIEPPSVVEQPSPSWSSRGSFSSFDTTDEGPVYCVPHEGEQGTGGIPTGFWGQYQGSAPWRGVTLVWWGPCHPGSLCPRKECRFQSRLPHSFRAPFSSICCSRVKNQEISDWEPNWEDTVLREHLSPSPPQAHPS